jgi:hypothetical protein
MTQQKESKEVGKLVGQAPKSRDVLQFAHAMCPVTQGNIRPLLPGPQRCEGRVQFDVLHGSGFNGVEVDAHGGLDRTHY